MFNTLTACHSTAQSTCYDFEATRPEHQSTTNRASIPQLPMSCTSPPSKYHLNYFRLICQEQKQPTTTIPIITIPLVMRILTPTCPNTERISTPFSFR